MYLQTDHSRPSTPVDDQRFSMGIFDLKGSKNTLQWHCSLESYRGKECTPAIASKRAVGAFGHEVESTTAVNHSYCKGYDKALVDHKCSVPPEKNISSTHQTSPVTRI